jgi:hypothetical protein
MQVLNPIELDATKPLSEAIGIRMAEIQKQMMNDKRCVDCGYPHEPGHCGEGTQPWRELTTKVAKAALEYEHEKGRTDELWEKYQVQEQRAVSAHVVLAEAVQALEQALKGLDDGRHP